MDNVIIVGPNDFRGKEIICRKIYVEKNNSSLVIGSLEDKNHKVISNAIIIIYEEIVKEYKSNKKEIGFTTSDENGNFRILLERSEKKNYILEVFH